MSATGNYRLDLSYDGRDLFGWQRNGDQPTVQLALEQAITEVLEVRAAVRGSGRTDRGAHATGQVASVALPHILDVPATVTALNLALPASVRVLELRSVHPGFDACESAVGKQYRYVIWNRAELPAEQDRLVWHVPGPLLVPTMIEAAHVFVGEHDFASFATRPNFKQKSTTRTVTRSAVRSDGPRIVFEIRANGFLYKMVRNIVRALVKVGEQRTTVEGLCAIMRACDRQAAPGTAPASGLYLDRVFYPGDNFDA